jgi:hypothetical protein
MNTSQRNHSSEHKEVALLLPWYVNRTLQSDETYLVEMHLKKCLLCKIDLLNLQKLSVSIRQEDLFAPAAQASFLQLKSRIHKNDVPSKEKTGVFETLSLFQSWFSRLSLKNLDSFYPPIVLASLLLLTFTLISPAFFTEKQNATDAFRTLSSSKYITQKQNEIRVVFSKEITQHEINQLVNSVQGQFVAGPSPQGVYRIRIGKENISSEHLMKVISLLRDKKQIIFAEPAFTSPSTNFQSLG